jgi:hypothetical protein
MEQTKGFFSLKGKIWGLNNKEAWSNDSKRSLSIGLQTSKENSLLLQVGEWKNSSLTIKVKGADMEKPEEFTEQEGIDKIKEVFKDGDSVYVNCRSQINTYKKRIDYMINQIYIEKEPIDFDSSNFEETNELNQSVVVTENPSSNSVKVGLVAYKGEMLEQELALLDPVVQDYFGENVKVGDLMKLTLKVKNIPIYEGDGEGTERKTLKGKSIKSGGKKIKDRRLEIEVVDVDTETRKPKEYNRENIRQALELSENKNQHNTPKVEDNDLPY